MQSVIEFLINHWVLTALLVAVLIAIVVEETRRAKGSERLSAQQATQLINRKDAVLIDTREKSIFITGRIADSVNIPLEELKSDNAKLKKYKDKPIILIATNETQLMGLLKNLRKEGLTVHVLAGGVSAWRTAGFPLVKG